tara:strand:+ start:8509 stop:9036 length:528 start_codon:yes stop_codon:yes gene_type:complete
MEVLDSSAGQEVLKSIPLIRGMMWEKIETFKNQIEQLEGCLTHKPGEIQSDKLKDTFPIKQHIEGGMYTREIFMPKGSLVISMIHKQNHPSFLLKGEVSYLTDNGEVERIAAPHKIFTKQGTQRVLYIHEDTEWCCVYKTDATNYEEAEADVYAETYKELPKKLIKKNKLLWLDY